jgi:hypothetical protein
MDDIAEAIEGLGMTVEQLHTEAAHGQFEVVCRYDEALKASGALPIWAAALWHCRHSPSQLKGGGWLLRRRLMSCC